MEMRRRLIQITLFLVFCFPVENIVPAASLTLESSSQTNCDIEFWLDEDILEFDFTAHIAFG